MGKTKNLMDFEFNLELTEDELTEELYMRNDFDYQYEEWKKSKEFVEFVNGEIDKTKPIYSETDIIQATRYASEHITLDPSEIGKKVYDMLYAEKIEEYLSLKR